MNRIRQLRQARKLTQEQLAEMCNTTQPQIKRLETGERKLTETWMRVLAKALGVRPADLLDTAAYADFDDDIEPATNGGADISGPLMTLGVAVYSVRTDSVELAGAPPGSRIVVDARKINPLDISAGSLVAAVATHDGKESLILRQFLPPSLLVTNRSGGNIAISTDDASFKIRIIGVVTRG